MIEHMENSNNDHIVLLLARLDKIEHENLLLKTMQQQNVIEITALKRKLISSKNEMSVMKESIQLLLNK